MGTTYKEAGVDIEAGDALVERIKPLRRADAAPEVLSGVGGFGGLFALPPGKYKEPVLVSGTDGVGTKLKLAFALDKHDTVGIDLVAMSVNDVLCCGAEPLFFLDYFATSKLDVDARREGDRRHRRRAASRPGCTLLGGETAELPGFYAPGEYELAGFCVGVVEKSAHHRRRDDRAGRRADRPGLERAALNGYSLARKICRRRELSLSEAEGSTPLGERCSSPTRIYVKDVLALLRGGEGEGPRAHHRQRHSRQRAALPARRDARGAAREALAEAADLRPAAAAGARSRATRCSPPSTWAWA